VISPRYLLTILAISLVGVAGGTALVANSALVARPASIKPTPTHENGSYSAQIDPLSHPARSAAPVIVATPSPTSTPTPKSTPKAGAKPSSSTVPTPARSASPTPVAAKPKPTPRPTPVSTPKPTPVPTPSGPITSGTLPPLTYTFSNGTSFTGDNYTHTFTCPGTTNCLNSLTFNVAAWGNYDIKVSYVETEINTGGGITMTPTSTGSVGPGWGPNSGATDMGMTGSSVNSIQLTITVAWA
jgi:hypothetical protein